MTRSVALFALALGILTACSGGGDGGNGPDGGGNPITGPDDFGAHTVGTIVVASGASQLVGAGQAVPLAPVIRVTSERGRPLRGASLTLTPEGNRGVLDATTAATNAAGEATFPPWVAPLTAGEFAVTVAAPSQAGAPITARVTAIVGEAPVTVSTQTVGTAGGTVAVTSATSAINGFTITVPAGALPSTSTFTITTKPAPTLPANLTAASPVIEIDGPVTTTDSLTDVRIPASVGGVGILHAFVIGSDNRLIPISTIRSDANSVTVALRQFLPPDQSSSLSLRASAEASVAINRISMILLRWLLPNATSFTSGFGIGRDNVSFANQASFWSSSGYCAGSSFLSGSWFRRSGALLTARAQFPGFLSKAETNDWGLVDQLNPAIRLATAMQQSHAPNNKTIGWWRNRYGQSGKPIWENVMVQIGLTQQPVYIVVYTADFSTGHAILARSIDLTQERNYVSDPNYPEITDRYLQYHSNTQTFEGFASAANVAPGSSPSTYTWFAEATYLFLESASAFANITNQYIANGLRTQYPPVAGRIKLANSASARLALRPEHRPIVGSVLGATQALVQIDEVAQHVPPTGIATAHCARDCEALEQQWLRLARPVLGDERRR